MTFNDWAVLIRLPLALILALAVSACSDGSGGSAQFNFDTPLGTSAELQSGPIEGRDSGRADSWEFLGIPYAAPPVAGLRWKVPQPVQGWSDTLQAQSLPPFCPQFLYLSNLFAGEEDCLYLNVFRPRTQERDLPVFLWVHGGGNNNGDTGQETPVYDGARLAERGNLVVVTIQYRLGALGWLNLPALHSGDPLEDSGNFGTLDIVQGLQWVQRNARAFGGDPGNVTFAGESAGAANILSLIVSSQAEGLFQRAILQSIGGDVTPKSRAQQESAALVDDLMAMEGISETPLTDDELAQYMRTVDTRTLLETAQTSQIIGDGVVIPTKGFELLQSGDFANKVPLLFGTNRDEYKLYTNPLAFNEYPDGPEELRAAVGKYISDAWRVTGADEPATQLRGLDDMPDLYVYRYLWGSPDENGSSPWPANFGATGGAFHSSEISFMMANEDVFVFPAFTDLFFNDSNAASRASMSEVMVSYWSNFAHSGDPNGNSLPIWEPWNNAEGAFKAVTLDVNYGDDSPAVESDFSVLTEQLVYQDARDNLSGDILEEVLIQLDAWFGRDQ